MSQIITVKTDKRKIKRDAEKVLGNDLKKIIAEIVINSDDSYKRLTSSLEDTMGTKSILITINKTKKLVTIIDNAEGMDNDDIKKNFEFYGADKSGRSFGHKVRGLFGQGASDVLFFAASHHCKSEIKSIKNDKFYSCSFKYEDNGNKNIYLKPETSAVRDIRKAFSIPDHDNGTVISFGIPPKITIPNQLVDKIRTFYMTRFIYMSKDRNVELITKNGKITTNKLQYDFPPRQPNSIIIDEPIEFKFDDKIVRGSLTLEKITKKDDDEYGELKILVYDNEYSVYDNTFFEYSDKHPGAENLFGFLKLDNTADIIREKLNLEHPEEILTDTRDGFNKNHEFYKSLNKVIEPLLKKALEQINSENKNIIVNSNNFKDWNKAFKEINKYFKETLEEDIGGDIGHKPPTEGIKFIRPNINITINKIYAIKLLINTEIIPLGSKISIYSDNNKAIEFSPKEFSLLNQDVKNQNFAIKSISIKGLEITKESIVLEAKANNDYKTKLFVNVVNKDIHYPNYGLEFWPNELITKPKIQTKVHLYIDINKFPLGSKIMFRSSNKNIKLTKDEIVLDTSFMIDTTIGLINCEFIGEIDNIEGTIVASCMNYETKVSVIIRSSDQPPIGGGGFFSGWEMDKVDQFWQTYFNTHTRKVFVNTGNYINKLNLGEINNVNPNPKFDKNQKKYISELCSNECAKQLILNKIKMGKISELDFAGFLDEIQKEKNKIMLIFYKSLFVDEKTG